MGDMDKAAQIFNCGASFGFGWLGRGRLQQGASPMNPHRKLATSASIKEG